MAMSKTNLGKAIADLITDENAPKDMKTAIQKKWTDIAEAIINEIKNADIVVASGISVSTSGTATAQKGSTTSTGTATIS